jgi:hypothetical protein
MILSWTKSSLNSHAADWPPQVITRALASPALDASARFLNGTIFRANMGQHNMENPINNPKQAIRIDRKNLTIPTLGLGWISVCQPHLQPQSTWAQ